jgi:uncharacterized membrane protein
MPALLFSEEDRDKIVTAIDEAEKLSTGEIQVHIEKYCPEDVLDRAAEVFADLGMHKTKQRSGVLFYLAVEDHKFAILGDAGINQQVPDDFWDKVKATMQTHFKQGRFTEGLCEGIALAAEQLQAYFPKDDDNENELPNALSFGK